MADNLHREFSRRIFQQLRKHEAILMKRSTYRLHFAVEPWGRSFQQQT